MYLRRSETGWEALAPAKLNLYLDVVGRRGDGFHELETIMVPVRLCDSLALSPRPTGSAVPGPIELNVRAAWGDRLATTQLPPSDERNLVWRALRLLQQRSGCRLGARVELVKRIPLGAGLGGGSSDAASALALANRAWQLGWSDARLARLSAELGSDIPFFFAGGPALCRGRGEIVEPLAGVAPLHFVIAKPAESLSTERVFAALPLGETASPRAASWQTLAAALRGGANHAWGRLLINRLELVARQLLPSLCKLQATFRELDFIGHQLTGSGSAYFGVCRNRRHAARMAALVRARLPGWVCATCLSR